jgi:hypothetical protein
MFTIFTWLAHKHAPIKAFCSFYVMEEKDYLTILGFLYLFKRAWGGVVVKALRY